MLVPKRQYRLISAVFMLAAASFVCNARPAAAATGVLVLRNGDAIHGQITQAGDRYLVTIGAQSELRIATDQVEMYCRDLDEAYRRKRTAIGPAQIEKHLSLAEWCLRHSLTSRAADELLAVMALDPRNSRLPALERRLQLSVGGVEAKTNRPVRKQVVVTLDELERTIRQLPADSVEDFTVNIQPLLLNRCATNSCHGANSENSFHLYRSPLGRSMTRRLTQRNLHSAMRYVNRQNPETSPLVAKPASPHGGMASPVFADSDRRQFEQLVRWVGRAAESRFAAAPEHISPVKPNLLQSALPSRAIGTTAAKPGTIDRVDYQQPVGQRDRLRRITPAFEPRDPFDPEIFNRRYFSSDAKSAD